MPSQPPPGSTGGSLRTPAPFQPAPDCTGGGSPRTPPLFRPAPGSSGGSARSLPAPSARIDRLGPWKRTVLVDWCLERVEGEEGKIRVAGTTYTPLMSPKMRKGASSLKRSRITTRRVFRSSAIVKRIGYQEIQSEDGYRIWLHNVLNIPKTRENGFSQEVCECFEFGFPKKWQSLVNPKIVPDNEHARSPSETTTSAPRHSVEYYIAKFLKDSLSSSFRYDSTENDYDTSVWYGGNTDGLATQSLSNLPHDNVGSITASSGYSPRINMPEKPLAQPGEACNGGQEHYQHESTSSISSNSKVDGNILAPSISMSHVNGSYRSTVGCGQAEEDADIEQENIHSCSIEHGMVTSQLGELGIPKPGKDLVNLGTTNALEPPTEEMTPKFGAIQGSEDGTGRRLRSGKVLGMPRVGPMKRGHKQKVIHQEASSKQMVDQGATSTSTPNLTSHKNGFSEAEVVIEEKLESHGSCHKGRGRPATGKGKRKRESTCLFSN